jgi:hypothetical protein
MGNMGCGCPGSMAKVIERPVTEETSNGKVVSELRQWPVQLHLVPPTAPYFKNAEILVCADCVAFAMGNMHQDLLRGKALAIACPKLDDTGTYVDKLATIFFDQRNSPCHRGNHGGAVLPWSGYVGQGSDSEKR